MSTAIDDNDGNEIIRYAYSGGIGATQNTGTGKTISHGTVSIQAINIAAAKDVAKESAILTYPPREGWYDHKGYASRVPIEQIIKTVETYNLLASRGIDYGNQPPSEIAPDASIEVNI